VRKREGWVGSRPRLKQGKEILFSKKEEKRKKREGRFAIQYEREGGKKGVLGKKEGDTRKRCSRNLQRARPLKALDERI